MDCILFFKMQQEAATGLTLIITGITGCLLCTGAAPYSIVLSTAWQTSDTHRHCHGFTGMIRLH